MPQGALLAAGFGIAVAMWGVGYFARLPFVMAPSPAVLGALLVAPLAVGWLAGRRGLRPRDSALAGALAGVLNLLVLGSFLTGDRPNAVHPSALIWVPGSIAVAVALSGCGAVLASRDRRTARPFTPEDWTASFARVAAAATFLLVIVGGLVTSNKAGLAVVDWPNSFRYNMFLYPFSRMTGGIYYEHAHRLFGSLVGLTTIALAVHLVRVDARAWLRRLALAAVVLVIVQGILGGLRVTGTFTLADDPERTSPNIYLAVAHGVLGQIFFAVMVAIAVFTSRSWRTAATLRIPSTDRGLSLALVGSLAVQLAFGAVQRHLSIGLALHIGMACVVALLGTTAGMRAWQHAKGDDALRRAGISVAVLVQVQFVLGFAAFVATRILSVETAPLAAIVATTTLHQANGALLLAASVALALRARRRVPEPGYLAPGASLGKPISS